MKTSGGHFDRTAAIASGILLVHLTLAGCASSERPQPVQAAAPAPPEPARAPSPARSVDNSDPFKTIAAELLMNMAPGKRIAIQPFRPTDVPVSLSVAQGFNDALARAIEASPDGTGVIVAREDLPRLFGEAEEFGEASGAQRLLESVRADVLMIGTVNPARDGVEISYKAFDARNGQQLAVATPQFVPVDVSEPTGLALDQALAVATDTLARDASDMKTVETLGIYYQQSEVETPLGNYIGRELVGQLLEKVRSHSVAPAALLRPTVNGTDKPPARDADDMMVRGRPGVYLLSGTLWDLGRDVEVRLSLRGDGDHVVSYGARIRRDTIPASMLPLGPPAAPSVRSENSASGIQLSSDRGQRPVYTVGDSAHLVVQTTRDGYLYCFHQASPAAGGGVTKIFPNPYHPDARIRGGVNVHIPEEGMGFALRVYGPAGVEYVRCFASDRDVGASLPPGLLDRDLEPIAVHSLEDIDRIFRNLPTVTVSDASLVMTVTPRSEPLKPSGHKTGVGPPVENEP